MRLLLVKLSALGDVIHTLPTLEALRRGFPRAHLAWLVEEAAAPLVFGHPAVDEVLVVRRRSWLEAWGRRGGRRQAAREVRGLIRNLREPGFDIVLDLQGLLKSAVWTAVARSPRKVGYDRTREGSYLALTERLPPFDPEAHAVRRYLNAAYHLGAPEGPPVFRVPLTAGTGEWLAPVWEEAPGPLVVMHPGARWATKLWPEEKWAALADRLQRRGPLRVVFTGSRADRPAIARIRGQMRTPTLDLAGRTTLLELARLLSQAHLAITTDTGPMHLAAAVGTRVAALFGPTAPGRTGPFGEGHIVVRRGLDCSPCFRKQCPEPHCLSGLTVAEVESAAAEVLRVARGDRDRPIRSADNSPEVR